MLLQLSVDVFLAIASRLEKKDFKVLRAACKNIDTVVAPILFSSIVLKPTDLYLRVDILKQLADGNTPLARWPNTVRVAPAHLSSFAIYGKDPAARKYSDEQIQDILLKGLTSLENVRVVSWDLNASDPQWLRDALSTFIRIHRGIVDLHLGLVENTNLPAQLGFMTGLNALRLHTRWASIPLLCGIKAMIVRNAATLTSLTLFCFPPPKIWDLFSVASAKTCAQLAEIRTDIVTRELFDYLGSYRGLQRLCLHNIDFHLEKCEADHLADEFFNSILPLHGEFLVELRCSALYDSRWSCAAHNVNALSTLHNLRILEMSVDSEHVLCVEPQKNAVLLLLQTASTLVHLHSLLISATNSERNRYAGPGYGAVHLKYLDTVSCAITTAVRAFRTHVASGARVQAGKASWQLGPVSCNSSEDLSRVFGYSEIDVVPTRPLWLGMY